MIGGEVLVVFFFKQKTAYDMRISDWSSDVCSSDLVAQASKAIVAEAFEVRELLEGLCARRAARHVRDRSEEHTSELQSLMRISYAVFCLKKKNTKHTPANHTQPAK